MNETDGERIARFVTGQCAEEERAAIEAWITADPAARELVESLTAVWQLTGAREAPWDVDAAWREFAMRRSRADPPTADTLHAPLSVPSSTARAPRSGTAAVGPGRRRAATWALRVAAAVLLIASGAVVWSRFSGSPWYAESSALHEYATGPGEQRELTLADGTTVGLAPASRLRVGPEFDGGPRDLQLEGQAAFDVPHDPRRPFRVVTPDGTTEVLGTRFVVRAYANDPGTAVALVEGSVRLRASDDVGGTRMITLQPGQGARAAGGAVRLSEEADAERLLAWAAGRLVFEDTPLAEAARELSRWYDVDIRLADAGIAERRLTASFGAEPFEQVIDLVSQSLNLSYERIGREVVLFGR